MRPFYLTKAAGRFSAFTLLELLISMSLLIVLISMIWSLIRVYSDYYTAGTRRIDRAQLVRALSQLLGDDLGAAIQDPIHPLPPSLAAGDVVRRFGLLGTSDSLRVDVIQINPLAPDSEVYFTRQGAAGPIQNVRMQVPELKTIYYDFYPLAAPASGRQSGLVRRELSFEVSGQINNPSPSPSFSSDAFADIGLIGAFPSPENQSVLPRSPTIAEQLLHDNDPNAMWAPEIVEIRFRYSDGANWQDSWDSLEKNGLPVAVEVVMKLMPVEDVEKLRQKSLFLSQAVVRPDRAESSRNDPTRSAGMDLVSLSSNISAPRPAARTLESFIAELGLAPPTEQRLVVYLATSPLIRNNPIRRASPPLDSRPPRAPTVRTPAPISRPSTTPAQPTAPSQQWLRN